MIRTLAAFLAVVLLTAAPAAAQPFDKALNLITVMGEGEVAIVPDLAILTGGVTNIGKSAREASESNARTMTAAMGALKAAGIADQDIQTARLSLYPVREAAKIGEPRISGFQASNQVSVKIRDLTKTADVIDRLVAAGANDIGSIQFIVSSPSKPLDAAREAAMADARRKAEIYAKAANVTLGPAVIISEEGTAAPGPIPMRTAREAVATPISPGEQTQRVTVSVSYELRR